MMCPFLLFLGLGLVSVPVIVVLLIVAGSEEISPMINGFERGISVDRSHRIEEWATL